MERFRLWGQVSYQAAASWSCKGIPAYREALSIIRLPNSAYSVCNSLFLRLHSFRIPHIHQCLVPPKNEDFVLCIGAGVGNFIRISEILASFFTQNSWAEYEKSTHRSAKPSLLNKSLCRSSEQDGLLSGSVCRQR